MFNKVAVPTVFEWAAIISAHGKHGHAEQAIALYHEMLTTDVVPNDYIFVAALDACSRVMSLTDGKLIHAHATKHGFESNYYVCSTLIHMYAKCGSLEDARAAFDRLPQRDRVTWTAMITGYAQQGDGDLALLMLQQMCKEGIQPDKVTIISALHACASIAAWDYGKLLHGHVIQGGFESDTSVANILIDMYVKCDSLQRARAVFDRLRTRDVVSWTALIGGYTEWGYYEEALKLFEQMRRERVEPNKVTHLSVLKACASAAALDYGRLVHGHIMDSSVASDVIIGNTLIHMYAKCGSVEDARLVFDRLPARDVVTWNAMLAAYAQQGSGQEALELFEQLQVERLQPNRVTFVSVVKACSAVASLDQAKQIHSHILESGLEMDVHVGSALVDMYAKCGSVEDSLSVFTRLPKRSLVSWNAMIAAYAQEGDGKKALQLFQTMQVEGFLPDKVTLLCLLSACSRAGLGDEGSGLFQSMYEQFGVSPEMEHYACMVDLLARAGYLEEAEKFIRSIPSQPDVVVWMCLLGACRDYGNVELAQSVFREVVEQDPSNAAAYVLMSNLYSSMGRWEDKAKVINLMHSVGVKKEPGRTWIEVKNRVHTFVVDDMDHAERKQIYAQLSLVLGIIDQEGRHQSTLEP